MPNVVKRLLCKFLGWWFLITGLLVVYGQTAPSIATPHFTGALILLLAGSALLQVACIRCWGDQPDDDNE